MMKRNFGRGSQVVRHGSAKAVFVGSIPTLASIYLKNVRILGMEIRFYPLMNAFYAVGGGTCSAEGTDSKY